VLNFIRLNVWLNDSYTKTPLNTKFRFPLIKLNNIIKQEKNIIKIQDETEYKRCRVQLYSKGIEIRDIVKGSEIKTKRQQVCKTNQLLVAEIDAKNGGYGIVPENLENAIVSNHYFLYSINEAMLLPSFLEIYLKTDEFHRQIKAIGSTNYAAIRSYHVLEYQIPLPSTTEQNALVAAYQNKINTATQAEIQAIALEKDIETYLLDMLRIEMAEKKKSIGSKMQMVRFKEVTRWDVWEDIVTFTSKYEVVKINKLIKGISTGTTPPSNNSKYFDGNVNFYTPSDLSDEPNLIEARRKLSELAITDKKARVYPKNTLLFVGIGSTVGKVGIIRNDFATSNQQITGIVFNESINIEYVYYYFHYNKNLTTKEQSKTTLPIVNQEMILNIQIPLPSLTIQHEIVHHITTQKAEIKRLKNEAAALRMAARTDFEAAVFEA
jgi:type I restriction enzyme, S subunit